MVTFINLHGRYGLTTKLKIENCHLKIVLAMKTLFLGRVHPKFLGKLDFEIGVYQKAPPIGGTFGEVSESPRLSGSARRARP